MTPDMFNAKPQLAPACISHSDSYPASCCCCCCCCLFFHIPSLPKGCVTLINISQGWKTCAGASSARDHSQPVQDIYILRDVSSVEDPLPPPQRFKSRYNCHGFFLISPITVNPGCVSQCFFNHCAAAVR